MFELYLDKRGEWRYRDIIFGNILFVGSESYKNRTDAERCVHRARTSTHDPITDLTQQ